MHFTSRAINDGGTRDDFDFDADAFNSVLDTGSVLESLAGEFELHKHEYVTAQQHPQRISQRPRARGAPSREDRYGHNDDVHDTILTSFLDQMMFGCGGDPESVVLLLDLSEEPQNADDVYEMFASAMTRGGVLERGTAIPTKEDLTAGLKVVLREYELIDLKNVSAEDKPRMLAAIAKELTDLLNIGCFSVVEMPVDRTAINSRIVLKVKFKANGDYDKHKARLVAKGFMEKLGSDFFSSFSPMASLTTARSLLAIAVHLGLEVFHSDIPQAFIKSILDADIWLRLPPGVNFMDDKGKAHRIVKLVRSLYGLRQSPQLFNKELVRFMTSQGFKQANSDSCLFTKQTPKGFLIACSEVDDILVTGTDNDAVDQFRQALVTEYEITDWDPISSFLGININYDLIAGRMCFDVENKIDKLFKQHSVLLTALELQGKSRSKFDTPLLEAHGNIADDTKLTSEVDRYIQQHYASINGALIYMGITCRCDFTFALSKTSKGMHDPRPKHVAMLKQLLGYTLKNKDIGLVFEQKPELFSMLTEVSKTDAALSFITTSDGQCIHRFTGFADANFANLSDDERKSNTGFIIFLFGCAICWRSKLQPITATSTHEAELIACASASQEIIWCRKLLQDLGFALNLTPVKLSDPNRIRECLEDDGITVSDEQYQLDPLWLFNDNLGTTQTINRPESSSQRSKHIDLRYYCVRQYVRDMKIRVAYIGTDYNIADFFTKGLTYPKFSLFRKRIGLLSRR